MTETDGWLKHYEATHSDVTYPAVYWAAVPMVVLGTVGILWTLPIPDEFFDISPLLNWGTAFLMATTVYYFIISVSLAIGMLPFIVGVAGVQSWPLCRYRSLYWSRVSSDCGWDTETKIVCAPYCKTYN
jgi:hypothetical protein